MSRADQRVLRRFGHVERMDEYHMARSVLMAEVSGGRVRGCQIELTEVNQFVAHNLKITFKLN